MLQENQSLMFEQTLKEENNYIWVGPLCDLFKISRENQYKVIKKDHILGNLSTKKSTDLINNDDNMAKMSTDFGKIDKNGRILLSKTGFIRWINIINPNIIEPELREKFIEYQTLISEYIYKAITSTEEARNNYLKLKKYERHLRYVQNKVRELKRITDNETDSLYGVQTQLALIEK